MTAVLRGEQSNQFNWRTPDSGQPSQTLLVNNQIQTADVTAGRYVFSFIVDGQNSSVQITMPNGTLSPVYQSPRPIDSLFPLGMDRSDSLDFGRHLESITITPLG